MIPKYFFLTKGVGKHEKPLLSFELALRDGEIQPFNLVNVSSIIPSGCKHISKEQGLKMLKPGEITFTVLVKNSTNKPRTVTASIGVALPSDREKYGYLSEYHSFGKTASETGEYAEKMAANMINTITEKQVAAEKGQKGKKELHPSKGLIKTTNITGSAKGDEDGLWTTVVAAAVFIP